MKLLLLLRPSSTRTRHPAERGDADPTGLCCRGVEMDPTRLLARHCHRRTAASVVVVVAIVLLLNSSLVAVRCVNRARCLQLRTAKSYPASVVNT